MKKACEGSISNGCTAHFRRGDFGTRSILGFQYARLLNESFDAFLDAVGGGADKRHPVLKVTTVDLPSEVAVRSGPAIPTGGIEIPLGPDISNRALDFGLPQSSFELITDGPFHDEITIEIRIFQ